MITNESQKISEAYVGMFDENKKQIDETLKTVQSKLRVVEKIIKPNGTLDKIASEYGNNNSSKDIKKLQKAISDAQNAFESLAAGIIN